MWAGAVVFRSLCPTLAIALAVLSGCANSNVSLGKSIKVVLSDTEVLEGEASLRADKFASKDLTDALLFDGVLEHKENDPSGEVTYQFRTVSIRGFMRKTTSKDNGLVRIVSPSLQNGGVNLDIGEEYKIYAPHLPDGRFGVWRGLVIPKIDSRGQNN